MKKYFSLGIPLALIGAAIVVTSHFRTKMGRCLDNGETYEVWLKEAEVSAYDRRGEPWDTDGSAPDLLGMMSWQELVVIRTVEASDGLIACWSDTAISATQAIRGEADTQSLQRVGRFRMDTEGSIEVCIFDNDFGSHSFAGGFRISLLSLRLGNNSIAGAGALKSVTLCVRETDAVENENASTFNWILTSGVQELSEPSAAIKSASERLFQDVGNTIYQSAEKIAEELKNQGEELGKELKNVIKKMNIK